MKVELSIADDRELRNAIHDMIKGEVTSIARGEIRGIIADVVKEGVIPKAPEDIEKMVRDAITTEVKKVMGERLGFDSATYLQRIVRDEIRLYLMKAFKTGQGIV